MEEGIHKRKLDMNENISRSIEDINLDIENGIKQIKKGAKKKAWQRKLKILSSSYILAYKSLSLKNIIIFWSGILLGTIFLMLSLNKLNDKLLISVPAYGGTLSEGIIGAPRHINPVLSVTDRGQDINKLIFSGLLKKDNNGNLINDMASDIEISDDELTYTAIINDKAKFHDGERLTADDIIYTVSKIQDKDIGSPLYINFEGVNVEKIDDRTVSFHLKKPFIYFKEYLTFGILPKHILEDLSSEEFSITDFNTKPIGSGPFVIKNVIKDSNGLIKEYKLKANKDYTLGRPFLNEIDIHIYQNEKDLIEAINNKKIESTAYLDPLSFKDINNKNKNILMSDLPNIFSISFNPNKNNILADKNVRKSLSLLINKQEIIDKIFGGYSTKKDFFFGDSLASIMPSNSTNTNILSEKEITITTADLEKLKQVADEVANYWRAAGIKVNINLYSLSEIEDIIKNRNFEVLLFGSIIEHDTDLYAYWHSNQRNYPGLNITSYVSKNLDKNLEKLREEITENERNNYLENINEELVDEMPATPIYSNDLNYLILNKDFANNIRDKIPKEIINKSERFSEINNWYKYKEKVWRFSYKKNILEKLQNLLH